MIKVSLILTLIISQLYAAGQESMIRIVVSADGKGMFRSIQGAINSLSDTSETPRLIYIKKGIYKEKIYLEKHNVILEGEDREKTVITQAIARDEWRCLHQEDWGVATLNVDGN